MSTSSLNAIRNYYRLTDTIGTAGQPEKAQFADIKEAGFELIINLAEANSPHAILNEEELVLSNELTYTHIPVAFDDPTLDKLEHFFDVMDANRGKNIFVHCALNMRVSAFMCLYQVIRQRIPLDRALAGLHKVWQPDSTWQAFITAALEKYPLMDSKSESQ